MPFPAGESRPQQSQLFGALYINLRLGPGPEPDSGRFHMLKGAGTDLRRLGAGIACQCGAPE